MKTRKLTNDTAYMISKKMYFDYDADSFWIGTTTAKNIIENYGVTKEQVKFAQAELKWKINEAIQFAKETRNTKTQVISVHIDSPRWRLGFVLEAVIQFYNRNDFDMNFDRIFTEAI